jgi:phage-related minor tail protein
MLAYNPLIMAGIVLITVGILYTIVSARAGVVLAGLGTVTAGVFLFTIVPNPLNPIAFFFNGLLVLCGLWMVAVGARGDGVGR